MENTGLVTIFLTGLLTGGLSCIAVQGGLLAATIAQREQGKLELGLKSKGNALPIISFLAAKLIAYTALGFLLGWLGSLIQLSSTARVVMQVGVAVFMIGTAFSILKVHPIFNYFIIQPPRFLTRYIRKKSKSKDIFAPAILGCFTVFIPCGTTQAMMALAIASADPFSAAMVLFAFVLGTSPVFFILGYFASRLGDYMQAKFMKIAAFTIILLALFNLNNVIALAGSEYTIENTFRNIWCTASFCNSEYAQKTATNEPAIEINNLGYSPNNIVIPSSSKITLHLKNTGGYGCAQAFTIPSLNIQRIVSPGGTDTVVFISPSKKGRLPFMCSMGMYRGNFIVI